MTLLAFMMIPTESAWGNFQISKTTVTCRELFFVPQRDGKFEKVLERMDTLNPDLRIQLDNLPSAEKTLQSIYLILKTEAWRVAPLGMLAWKNKIDLMPDMVARMNHNFGAHFDLSKMNDTQLRLFYVNALHSQYIFVAEIIKQRFLAQKIGRDIPNEIENRLMIIVDRLLIFDLGSRELPPEKAREVLAFESLTQFPWMEAFHIVKDSLHSGTPIQNHPLFATLSIQHQEILETSMKTSKRRYCCLKDPGCIFCPNNRAFLHSRNQ